MTQSIRQSESGPGIIGPAVVPLLALAVFINYVDRGNLAIAAPLIKEELHLSSTQIGVLVSAFFWSYVPAQFLAGWLAERINAYRTLAMGLALWSVATATSGLVTGFGALLLLRVLLGLGESTAFPCSSKLLALHLPAEKLGSANGLIGFGMGMGPALGTLLGGLLMAWSGWRNVFLTFGLLSLCWLVPWHAATRSASRLENAAAPMQSIPSFVSISRRRELWGASLGHFCANYGFYFVISWLPLYLIKSRGLSITHMAAVSGLVYGVYAFASVLTGRISDHWIRAIHDTNRVRKMFILVGHAGVTLSLLVAVFGNLTVAIVSLVAAGICFGLITPTLYAIGQTLAGPQVAGQWIGIQNAVGNLAGIIAPMITGLAVDITGRYDWAFVIAATVTALGMVGWGIMIVKVEPLAWGTRPACEPVVASAAA